jgi:hypothetical protein
MPSTVIGWTTIAEAEAYFLTRLSSDAWTSIPADSNFVKKTAALTTAYDRLFYSGLFDLPAFADASAAQLVVLKKAQYELSLYMLLHLADEDRRRGLQAQGVIEAGIVKEKYSEKSLMALPIPPFVALILDDYSAADSELYVSSIDRDEDEDSMKL